LDEHLLRAAEAVLADVWGATVTCEVQDVLRGDGYRSRVDRLRVSGGPVASVIFKAAVGADGRSYQVGDPAPGAPFSRLVSEWAGLDILAPSGLGPRALGGDVERGFCLIEDLGTGDALADRLLGDDPEAARRALFAYARSLGDMHTATLGAAARWEERRQALGAAGSTTGFEGDWEASAAAFTSYLQSLGIAPPALADDLAAVGAALAASNYLAFTPSDCCPDNHVLRGDGVVFFDCEGALMRHALIDAAYFIAPFPTCWCCARMPDGLPDALIAAYRERFPGGDDFDAQLTMMLAYWIAVSAPRGAFMGWGKADRPWSLSTIRQRALHGWASLLARPGAADLLPGFSEAVAALHAQLAKAWEGLEPMPLYPAFGGPPGAHPGKPG
jgi:hypothetical protein